MKPIARLPKSAFAATYSSGKVLRHPLLQLRILRRNDGRETVNIAFAVGKKLGKATTRNKLRRRMRAAFVEENRVASTRAPSIAAQAHSQDHSRQDDLNENTSCRHSHEKSPLEKLRGANLIFLASSPALEADFVALRQAIGELTRRAASR